MNQKTIRKIAFTLLISVTIIFLTSCDNSQPATKTEEKKPLNERTFKSCYRIESKGLEKNEIKWETKKQVPDMEITISKNSTNSFNIRVSYYGNDYQYSIINWSVSNLEFDSRFVKEGKYFYDGRDSNYNSLRIMTFRPLEEFISKGASSDNNYNVFLYIVPSLLGLGQASGFGVQ